MGKNVPQKYLRTNDIFLAMTAFWSDAVDRGKGLEVFYCGNCNKKIVLDGMSEPPRVCTKCGDELYWEALGKSKICPACKRGFAISAEFCEYCIPSVRLEKGDS